MAEPKATGRHCTHCQSALEYKGLKEIHEGQPGPWLLRRMACDVYVCVSCGHVEFFYPEGADTES